MAQFVLVWNRCAAKISSSIYQMGMLMIVGLGALALLRFSPLGSIYLGLATAATFVIRISYFKGVAVSIALMTLFSGFLYFSYPEIMTPWQWLWVGSLCMTLYLIAEGCFILSEDYEKAGKDLKQQVENTTLWKTRFETLQYQLEREKEKIDSLENEIIVLEEKHEERIESLKQLIEITSSESAKYVQQMKKIVEDREELEERVRLLLLETDELKSVIKEEKEPIFSDAEALVRLKQLNEARFQNYQLDLILTQYRKEQKIQDKVKRERAPRQSSSIGQEKITLQDLAKVISKNIK
jgi:hypothetical protein